jgi:hypothetical protein
VIRERKLVASTAIALVVLGALCLSARLRFLQGSALGSGQSVWRITYDIELLDSKAAKVYVAIPSGTVHCRIFRESFSHHGLWMDMIRSAKTRTREVVIVPLLGFDQGRFTADFDIHLNRNAQREAPAMKHELTARELSHYLREEPVVQTTAPVVSTTAARLKTESRTRSQLLDNIFDYCAENIVENGPEGPSDAASTLEQAGGTCLGCASAMVALCRAVKIPARLVVGFELASRSDPRMNHWVEVFVKKRWRPYDPVSGYRGELPPRFVPIRVDGADILRASGDATLRTRFAVRRTVPDPILRPIVTRRWLSIGDLTRLTPGMQATAGLVLLLPVAALLTAMFRNLIGIRTFGTFAPSLIALSFVQADWRTGAMVFFIVLTTGMLGRLFLSRLQLLMVPRLGVILTLVVLTMILGISILDYLGLTPTASAALFPMVILTTMVERFNITAEEDGYREAFVVLGGTLMVAACCLVLLRVEYLGQLVLAFPEVLLFVAAALLLAGRYTGYRLTELWRFRDLLTDDVEESP